MTYLCPGKNEHMSASSKFFITILFLSAAFTCFAQNLSPEQIEQKEFLTANKSVKGVKSTNSGLQYKIIDRGKGKKPEATDEMYVKYVGRFADGTIFDQSTDRPAVFRLNGIIRGMAEGLTLIGAGGKIIMYIPSELAYGSAGAGDIPPDKLLIFEVELVEIYNEATD